MLLSILNTSEPSKFNSFREIKCVNFVQTRIHVRETLFQYIFESLVLTYYIVVGRGSNLIIKENKFSKCRKNIFSP